MLLFPCHPNRTNLKDLDLKCDASWRRFRAFAAPIVFLEISFSCIICWPSASLSVLCASALERTCLTKSIATVLKYKTTHSRCVECGINPFLIRGTFHISWNSFHIKIDWCRDCLRDAKYSDGHNHRYSSQTSHNTCLQDAGRELYPKVWNTPIFPNLGWIWIRKRGWFQIYMEKIKMI